MILSIDTQKTHWLKSNNYLWLKKTETLSKLGSEGNFLNLIKSINEIAIVSIVLDGEMLAAFPLKSGIS